MKFKKSIIVLFIISIFVTTFNYNVKAEDNNEVIHMANEIIIGNDIEITINLHNINYSKFKFILDSNNALNNIELNSDINLTFNTNEVLFEYDKSNTDLKSLTLKYSLPNTIKVGDTISYKITIINLENEEDYLTFDKSINIIEKNQETSNQPNTNNKTNTNNQQNNNNKLNNNNYSNNKIIQNNNFTQNKQTNTSMNVSVKNDEQITYKGSDNNYLKSLSISGYSLNKKFSKDNSTYFIKVGKNVSKIKVNATKDNSNSIVKINGNTNLKIGLNKVLITVYAENNESRVYRIYVTKEA